MEYYAEREIIDYVMADVASKAKIIVKFDYLPPDLRSKVMMAVSEYKKMRSLRSLIIEYKKKTKKIFVINKAQVLQELENYEKEYKKIEEKYQQIVEEIASRLKQTSIDNLPLF